MKKDNENKGPKFHLDIEGKLIPWDEDTITTEKIIELGGWDASQGAILIDDKTQVERTLKPGEVIEIKPGMGFAKKVSFKRGLITSRIEEEFDLIKTQFPNAEFKDNWIKVPNYKLPVGMGWNKEAMDVAFLIPVGYPGTPPYGLYVASDLLINNERPNDFNPNAENKPPFEGKWGMISWTIDDQWKIHPEITKGTNLLNVIHSFAQRFNLGK